MKILMLYVPVDSSVDSFMRLVRLLKDASYRIAAADFDGAVATLKFERTGDENG